MTDESEFYTVVYEVKKSHHNEWWPTIQPLFLLDNVPIRVTGVALGDLIERVDQLETAREDQTP